MNTDTYKEIEKVNDILQDLLGITGENILTTQKGNSIYILGPSETLDVLKNCSCEAKETFDKVRKILYFYYPRWIAYNAIQKSNDHYKDFSSNNELLIALTSIIDWLANPNNVRGDYTKRLKCFLTKNLDEKEINELINNFYVVKQQGNKETLKSLEELGEYIYEVRSWIIHKAELHGFYPFYADFDIDSETGEVKPPYYMITPKDFREILWKAIFNSLGLKIIALPHKVLPKNENDKQTSYFL